MTPEELNVSTAAVLYLLRSAEHYSDGELTNEDIVRLAINAPQIVQVWAIMKGPEPLGVAVTEIVQYPRFKALRVMAAGGRRFKEWKEYEAVLEQFANAEGCRRLEAYVRPGMAKELRTQGYKESRRLVMKYTFGGYH